MTRRYCALVCYRSRQEKVWYRTCDLFAKTNLSLVYSANKNFKLTSLSPVEFSYETGPFGAMCGLCAVYVRLWCGLCAVFARCLCYFGATLARSLCYFGATLVRSLCYFGAVFVLLWCGLCAILVRCMCGISHKPHIHRANTGKRKAPGV